MIKMLLDNGADLEYGERYHVLPLADFCVCANRVWLLDFFRRTKLTYTSIHTSVCPSYTLADVH